MSVNNSKAKVVLVTGVSKGVGRELFKQFSLSPDITIIGLSRDKVLLDQLHLQCTEIGGSDFHLLEMDLTQNSISRELTEILNFHERLDVLINNAGTIVNKPFNQITSAELIKCYSTNVFAPFHFVQQLLPWLSASQLSHVVNIGSMGGVQGSAKFSGLSAYTSSKGALITLTECLAEELKDKSIRVNCVNLGAVQTEMLSLAFPGYKANHQPDSVASWLINFALTAHHLMNGKSIQLSDSTP